MKLFKVMTAIFALALIASVATLALAPRPGPASADGGPYHGDATFTKWVTNTHSGVFPWDMEGVVGGSVGAGTFAGQIFSRSDDGTTTTIHAVYHINGGKQSFTADIVVRANDATGIAKITGFVTGGPLDGSHVTGGYRTMSTCDIPTPGNVFGDPGKCFKGTLHIPVA